MDTRQMVLMGLAAFAAVGFGYAFIIPYMEGEFRAEERQKRLTGNKKFDKVAAAKKNRGNNKVAEALDAIERREKGDNKLSLLDRIKQAGLEWDARQYYLISAAIGLVCAGLGFYMGQTPLHALGGLVVGGVGVPAWLLTFLKKKRLKKFLKEFPNAVDVIVRGVKSGLPLGDCIRIIANEAAEPVKGEFRSVMEQQTLGLSLADAVATLPKRVPCAESSFFAIVVEIQSKSGGNLSEVLGNLSKVLRDRRKMADKVTAMSMEAKSSAGIIAARPFVVGILVYITSPGYIALLWTTETGKMVMMGGAVMMAMGIAVMKKMISFDI